MPPQTRARKNEEYRKLAEDSIISRNSLTNGRREIQKDDIKWRF